jgi:hypothetical protein
MATAQNIDRNDIKFDFAQLPAKPLADKTLKNYQTKSSMAYASDVSNQKLSFEEKVKKADADYEEEVRTFDARKKEAKANHDAAMVEWRKKTLAERVILKDKAPTLEYVPAPYKKTPVPEKYQKVFNEGLVASYVKLDGFKNSPENAVKISINLLGFEATDPEVKTKETTTSSGKSISYWSEIKYKHPIGYKVELPNGEVIFEDYPKEMAEFSTYSTSPSTSGSSLSGTTLDALMQRLQNEIVEKNLKMINEMVNSDYGYRRMTRETEFVMVSSKSNEYPEYKEAYDNCVEGCKGMTQDAIKAASLEKIKKAVEIWEKDMLESKPADKNARIDADVTMSTLFNLIEAQIWIGDYTRLDNNMSKLNRLDLSKKERKRYESLTIFVSEQRVRFEANK